MTEHQAAHQAAQQPPVGPPEEAALRAELEEVREGTVEQWESGDDMTGREMLGTFLGSLVLGVGVLLTAVAASSLDDQPLDIMLTVAALALLAYLLAWRLMRSTVRRRVEMLGQVRRLRRRERELLALLPPGDTGPGVYRRYYARRFGHPAILALYALGGLVVVLVLLT